MEVVNNFTVRRFLQLFLCQRRLLKCGRLSDRRRNEGVFCERNSSHSFSSIELKL